MLDFTRQKAGKGHYYLDQKGQRLTDERTLQRIKSLRIPPAWRDVRICSEPHGHIQAVGHDAKGRKQYIYHPDWVSHQQQHKFDKLIQFGEVLPELRKNIHRDMQRRGMGRERVIATVVWLLQHTFMRIGNREYTRENNSYGLTTLREKHVEIEGERVKFSFKGKSGVYQEVEIDDPRVKKIIQHCIEIPGYELFQYMSDGQRHIVDSRDVNDYLHQVTGQQFSAKDFRTWGGTSLAATTLYEIGQGSSVTATKKLVAQAVKEVSHHLNNTPTVCRKYYIHPTIIDAYQQQVLVPHFAQVLQESTDQQLLLPEEYATWSLLKEYTMHKE